VAPVAFGVDVAQEQFLLNPGLDRRHRPRDLAGDEGFAPGRAFVIEQDAVGGVETVGLAVIHGDPVGVKLGRGVGAARIEGGGLALGDFLDLAVKLGRRGLIKAHGLFQAENANRLQQPQCPQAIGVGGVFRGLEADLDVALGRQIVNLGGLDFLDQPDQVGRVGQVAVVKEEPDILMAV
jgi:hypothetical protein